MFELIADMGRQVIEFRNKKVPRPLPFYGRPYQSGITDPLWPVEPPQGIDPKVYAQQRGRVDKQGFLTLVRADVRARDAAELRDLLQAFTLWAHDAMEKKPSRNHLQPLAHLEVPESYRVTVTLGLGATLFADRTGFDRFGIRAARPRFLKPMPAFPGDAPDFSPAERASDLAVVIASDHPYVNVAVARDLAQHFNRRFDPKRDVLRVGAIEQGFQRADKRELLRFDDGIDNLRAAPVGDLERLVYVAGTDPEPAWCAAGSYLVYRKIRENLPVWEAFAEPDQERAIGRRKKTGKPLSRESTGPDGMTPVFPDPTDPVDGPLNAHVRKVQPRRPEPDLFGLPDTDRRFLRRPYPYFEGLDSGGEVVTGLHFLAFMKSIQQQFEHVTNMWQMNPDFPVPGTGIDALYARGVLSTVDGGYFFCPPAPAGDGDFLASGIFG